MKKKIFGFIAVAALAVVAGWNYQQDKQNFQLSGLALENVEALAQDEIKNGYAEKNCNNIDGNISCTCTGSGQILFCI